MANVQWDELELEMVFTTPLCGGVPRSDKVVDDWIKTQAASEAEHKRLQAAGQVKTLDEVATERRDTRHELTEKQMADEAMAKVWVGFSKDDTGLFVRGANIRAHLKDCASVVGQNEVFKNVKALRSKIVNRVYVKEERVYLRDEKGAIYQDATSYRDATLSVFTAQGPRTCLKRVDMLYPCRLMCHIQFFAGYKINRDMVLACLDYGQVHGFNQDRSLQFGRYEYTLGVDDAAKQPKPKKEKVA